MTPDGMVLYKDCDHRWRRLLPWHPESHVLFYSEAYHEVGAPDLDRDVVTVVVDASGRFRFLEPNDETDR